MKNRNPDSHALGGARATYLTLFSINLNLYYTLGGPENISCGGKGRRTSTGELAEEDRQTNFGL